MACQLNLAWQNPPYLLRRNTLKPYDDKVLMLHDNASSSTTKADATELVKAVPPYILQDDAIRKTCELE